VSKVAVLVKLTAKEGQRDELVKALDAALATAAAEEGTIFYILHADSHDPHVLWFYELYRDQDAYTAHGTSDAFRAVGRASAPYAAGRPELVVLEPLGGKGL
jgi:quinol monooxygenase YgiN